MTSRGRDSGSERSAGMLQPVDGDTLTDDDEPSEETAAELTDEAATVEETAAELTNEEETADETGSELSDEEDAGCSVESVPPD